ncbi:MAG: TlpA disulfide reductase family protein [Neisseria sp.]|nr:TlpA disulfide reductase family protein [Neisseria sp.]
MLKKLGVAVLGLALSTAAWADGRLYDLNTHEEQALTATGQPIVEIDTEYQIVNMWAPWCPPCLKEMPTMAKWYKKQNKKRVKLIGLAMVGEKGDTLDDVRHFAKRVGVNYPIWYTQSKGSPWYYNLGNGIDGQPKLLPFTVVQKRGCVHRLFYRLTLTHEKGWTQLLKDIDQKCAKP